MADIKEQSKTDQKLRSLEAENKLLMEQLSKVQEKYEELYRTSKEPKPGVDSSIRESSSTIAFSVDILRHPFINNLISLHKMENEACRKAAFEFRLGSLITTALSSPRAFMVFPIDLYKLLCPGNSDFGKDFSKIIELHKKEGENGVEKKLIKHPPKSKASAYTALARHLSSVDKANAAKYAEKAWLADPTPSRLKWLAFRTRDAGNPLLAYIMLAFLPTGVPFSDSEKRAAEDIKRKTEGILLDKAKSNPEQNIKSPPKVKAEGQKAAPSFDSSYHERLSSAFQTVVLEFGKDKKGFESLMRTILMGKKS